MKLNLGCGNTILDGYVNLDKIKLDGVDVIHDLDVPPYPFKDNTFDYIKAIDVLEHVSDLPTVMAELHRILKKGGRLHIHVPYYKRKSAYSDPTHKQFFTDKTLLYFTGDWGLDYYLEGKKFKKIYHKKQWQEFPFYYLNKKLGTNIRQPFGTDAIECELEKI